MMKGAELSDDLQYTQDTQLHPRFLSEVATVEDTLGSSMSEPLTFLDADESDASSDKADAAS